ncbi:MAG: hypothetical protein P1U56_22700 [Saprospiraceae bacterium]|nr:hypothetical protein [Saprospiraceae bacterium]
MNESKIPEYASGEISNEALYSICARGVAIFSNKLHVLGKRPEEGGINEGWPLVHQQFHLSNLKLKKNPKGEKSGLDLVDSKSLKDPKSWNKQEMKHEDFKKSGYSGNEAHPALTASQTEMWAFYQGWNKSLNSPLIGRQCTLDDDDIDDGPIEWGEPINMQMADGTPIKNVGAVSARHFGPDQIIIVAGGVIGLSSDYGHKHENEIFIGIFNLEDLDKENNRWSAISSQWLKINEIKCYVEGIEFPLPLTKDFGLSISFDWFLDPSPLKKPSTSGGTTFTDKSEPGYGLAIEFTPIHGNISPTFFISLQIEEGTGKVLGLEKEALKGNLRTTETYSGVSGLMRDPAGRLRTFEYNYKEKQIESCYYNTSAFPSPENKFNSSSDVLPKYGMNPARATYDQIKGVISAIGAISDLDWRVLPRGVHHIFTPGKISHKEGKEDENQKIVDDYPILEFTVYNRNKCQLNYYGTIRTTKAKKKPKHVKTNYGPKIIIGGVIDGPIPFPIENYVGYEMPAGPDEVGSVNYTTIDEKEKEDSKESSWTAGIESEGKTTEGFGPAWNISVEGGMGSLMKKSQGTETEHKLSVLATVENKDKHFRHPEIDGKGAAKVLAAEFLITGTQFIDVSNKIINDSLSKNPSVGPKTLGVLTTMIGTSEFYSFETYSAIPGNLESYTPEKLNERMKEKGYKGKDYFNEVIQANAFPFTEDEPYLIFKWNANSIEGSGFHAFKSSFQEQKWTYEGKFYGGVSGGGGIDFFGMGEEFETSFLAGASYSRENSEATTKKTTWGIEVEGKENWGGPPPRTFKDAPESIAGYTFRLYFLPVPNKESGLHPNYWTKELIDNVHDGERIDPNSGSWRIMYVVTLIEYNDPNKERYDYEFKTRSNISS